MELGATNIIVRSVEPQSAEGKSDRVKTYGLLRADYRRMLSNIPTITRAVPIREVPREFLVNGRTADVNLVGSSIDYLELNRLEIARGRWITEQDGRENVIVLADQTAKRLFPMENPIGKKVGVESDVYTVIGQTKPRAASAAIGGSLAARDYAFDAYIPLETFRHRVGDQIMVRVGEGRGFDFTGEIVELTQITLTVGSMEEVDETAAIVETLFKRYHDKEDYAVVVPKELLRQAERTRAMFNVLLVVIAGISLLGRWDRDHEHHVGDGHRTDSRDRHSSSLGSKTPRHHLPVLDRDVGVDRQRRIAGRRIWIDVRSTLSRWCRSIGDGNQSRNAAADHLQPGTANRPVVGHLVAGHFARRRARLWRLPGKTCRLHEPNRRAAPRVALP